MPTFSIRSSDAPSAVRCDGATVTNQGPTTVYYSDSQDVSSTSYEGSLASGASAALDGIQFFVVASDPLGSARASLVVGAPPVLVTGDPRRVSASAAAMFGTAAYPTGTNIGHESRQRHRSAVAGRGLELTYALAYAVAEASIAAGVDRTVRAAVEYPAGTFYAAYTRDGKRDATVTPGGTCKLFVPGVEIPAATDFWVRSQTVGVATDAVVPSATADSTLNEYGVQFSVSQDHTTTDTGKPAANSSPMFAPITVTIAPFTRTPSVALIVDSIGMGKGDPDVNGAVKGPGGWAMRALSTDGSGKYSPRWPVSAHGIGGEKAQNFATGSARQRRIAALDECAPTHAFVLLGTNDVPTRTAALVMPDLLAVWTLLANRGIKVYGATMPPGGVTTTDAYATLANQTVPGTDQRRIDVNNWIRDGAPIDPTTKAAVAVGTAVALRAAAAGHPLTGWWELADTVESARDSGKWKVDGSANTYTTDGTHPSTLGHQAMAAAVNTLVIQ